MSAARVKCLWTSCSAMLLPCRTGYCPLHFKVAGPKCSVCEGPTSAINKVGVCTKCIAESAATRAAVRKQRIVQESV